MAGYAGAGAAQGAAQGFAQGGLPGAIVGAIGGFFGGKEAARAEVYANRANQTRRQQQFLQAAIQRRDIVRQSRFARAEQLAAASAAGAYGMLSSGYGGAMSSLMSQTGRNLQIFDANVRDEVQASFWEGKAKQKQAKASNIMGITSALTQVAGKIEDNLTSGLTWYGGQA